MRKEKDKEQERQTSRQGKRKIWNSKGKQVDRERKRDGTGR